MLQYLLVDCLKYMILHQQIDNSIINKQTVIKFQYQSKQLSRYYSYLKQRLKMIGSGNRLKNKNKDKLKSKIKHKNTNEHNQINKSEPRINKSKNKKQTHKNEAMNQKDFLSIEENTDANCNINKNSNLQAGAKSSSRRNISARSQFTKKNLSYITLDSACCSGHARRQRNMSSISRPIGQKSRINISQIAQPKHMGLLDSSSDLLNYQYFIKSKNQNKIKDMMKSKTNISMNRPKGSKKQLVSSSSYIFSSSKKNAKSNSNSKTTCANKISKKQHYERIAINNNISNKNKTRESRKIKQTKQEECKGQRQRQKCQQMDMQTLTQTLTHSNNNTNTNTKQKIQTKKSKKDINRQLASSHSKSKSKQRSKSKSISRQNSNFQSNRKSYGEREQDRVASRRKQKQIASPHINRNSYNDKQYLIRQKTIPQQPSPMVTKSNQHYADSYKINNQLQQQLKSQLKLQSYLNEQLQQQQKTISQLQCQLKSLQSQLTCKTEHQLQIQLQNNDNNARVRELQKCKNSLKQQIAVLRESISNMQQQHMLKLSALTIASQQKITKLRKDLQSSDQQKQHHWQLKQQQLHKQQQQYDIIKQAYQEYREYATRKIFILEQKVNQLTNKCSQLEQENKLIKTNSSDNANIRQELIQSKGKYQRTIKKYQTQIKQLQQLLTKQLNKNKQQQSQIQQIIKQKKFIKENSQIVLQIVRKQIWNCQAVVQEGNHNHNQENYQPLASQFVKNQTGNCSITERSKRILEDYNF